MIPTNTFIKAAEIWIPAADQSLLEFGTGAFGPAMAFANLSRSMCFGRGEGLPGRAWDEAHPILLPRFESTYFRRTAAAHASGLTAAVAVPFFNAGRLDAVLVIFCGHSVASTGALEVWHADAAGQAMTLVEGAYGAAAPAFESVSRQAAFARGVGLPGLAWDHGQAEILEDLGASDAFLRAARAADAGLVRGLAIPLGSYASQIHVLGFLASAGLPLAHRIERWVLDNAGDRLRRVTAFSELHGGHSQAEAWLPLGPDSGRAGGSIARAWTTGAPAINQQPGSEPGPPAAAAAAIGATGLLAIPIVREDSVSEVLVLYL